MKAAPFALGVALAVQGCAGRIQQAPPLTCDATASRWAQPPDGRFRNLRVWIDARAQTLDGWQPSGWRRLQFAMDEWNSIQLPIRFVRAQSLRDADVIVDVIEQIPGQDSQDRDQAGITTLTHQAGIISRARVFLATSAPFGVKYSVADQVSNLIHELGHAMGLQHVAVPGALMSARRVSAELTAADIALARRHFAPCSGPADAGGRSPR